MLDFPLLGLREMGQSVCRTCWTWYSDGESVCPSCKLPLWPAGGYASPPMQQSAASEGQPAFAPGPPAGAGGSGIARILVGLGAVAAVAVIGFAIISSLNLGGPIHASDGSFSVKNPGGWYPTTWSLFKSYNVVLSIEALKDGGKSDFAVVDPEQEIPLEQIPAAWERLPTSGTLPPGMQLGGMTSRTVGGAPAFVGDVDGVKDGTPFRGQLLFINYNNRTYIVALASTTSTYSSMRSDYGTLLSSWTWLH